MRIILATPLFPPETEEIAVYSKRFLEETRLLGHDVSAVVYADHPESIPGITIKSVSKRGSLPIRLMKCFFELAKISKNAEVIYAENTLASGFPATLAGFFRGVPLVIHFTEDEVEKTSEREKLPRNCLRYRQLYALQKWTLKRAGLIIVPGEILAETLHFLYDIAVSNIVIMKSPLPKPDILPFETAVSVRKIFLPSEETRNAVIAYLTDLQKEFSDTEIFVLSPQASTAEKWFHIKTSSIVLYSGKDASAHILPMALASGTPSIDFNIVGAKDVVKRVMQDFAYREVLAEEERKTLEKYSWKKHLQTFINISEYLR